MYILVSLIHVSYTLGTGVLRRNAPKVNVKWPRPPCKTRKSKISQHHPNMNNFSHTEDINKSNSKVRYLIKNHHHKPRLKCQSKLYWDSHTRENNYTIFSSKNANYLHNSTCLLFSIIIYLIFHDPLRATGIPLALIVFSQQQFQFSSFHILSTFDSLWKFCYFVKQRIFISTALLDNEMSHLY